MKLKPTRSGNIQDAYAYALNIAAKQADKGAPLMTHMRGGLKARTLLIAPPPSVEEYTEGVPFSGRAGQSFHEFLDQNEISTENDCLVVACLFTGTNKRKANTLPIQAFVDAVKMEFDRFICVGPEAFSYTFNDGKKPPASLLGQIVHLPKSDHKPVFIFPSVEALVINFDEAPREQQWQLSRMRDRLFHDLEACVPTFLAFMKK